MTKVKQIYPAHADHISNYTETFIKNLFDTSRIVCQRKYDGERLLLHFNCNEVYCTTRRISKKTNKYTEVQDRIKDLPKLNVDYTVIDCEFYSDTWSNAVGILHSLPNRALELQNNVKVNFAVFDCLFFNGIDIRDKPYEIRLHYLEQVLMIIHDSRFHFVEQTYILNINDAYKKAQEQWNSGHEGVVIKPLILSYYDKAAMIKIKKFETLDVVVCGYKRGQGKYKDTVGALEVGYYDPQHFGIVKLCNVNCGSDEEREKWRRLFSEDNAFGRVIEIKCQEVTEKSLRHPVYIRTRFDKDKFMCTKETIFTKDS